MKMKSMLLALAAALAACAAQAQVYVVASGGLSQAEEFCDRYTVRCKESGTGLKLLVGQHIGPDIGLEIGYYSLGKASGIDSYYSPAPSFSIRTDGPGVGLAGFLELTPQVRLFARGALAAMNTRFTYDGVTESDRNLTLLLGAGLGLQLQRNLSLDLSVDFGKHEYRGATSPVTVVGLGITAGF